MNMTTRAKYRPVLTAAQIEHILYMCKTEEPISDVSISLISSLAPFQAKIKNAGIAPAYTAQPTKPTILMQLGGEAGDALDRAANAFVKEDYWEACYMKQQSNPVACNLEEIQAANEWRYLKDMMDDKEKTKFEQGII